MIQIDNKGQVTAVYDDELRPVFDALGTATIKRASHVEPDDKGMWWADLVDGPIFGPFIRRADALAAEVAWLEVNL
jgi:hypothetical protein